MSALYRAVNWNRQKYWYDGALALSVLGYLAAFVGATLAADPDATLETALIRGLGTGAFTLLTVILCIGPLARLDPRFLPLLYNRRHLGVSMFTLALAHGGFAVKHGLGCVGKGAEFEQRAGHDCRCRGVPRRIGDFRRFVVPIGDFVGGKIAVADEKVG